MILTFCVCRWCLSEVIHTDLGCPSAGDVLEKVHPILILAVVCLQVMSLKVHPVLILAVVCLQVVSWKVHPVLILAVVCLQVVSWKVHPIPVSYTHLTLPTTAEV